MDPSVHNLLSLLVRSRLFAPDEAKALYQQWREEAGEGTAEAAQFSRWLVARQHLTEYQANLLSRGHSQGFFLQQYKILDRVGRGAVAGVYKAVSNLGQVVALKVLAPSRAKDPPLRARFERESRLVLRLNHPNVVRGYQTGEADGYRYLVMEYLDGETLAEVLQRRGKLPPVEAARLIHQALLGLEHIRERGLIHRDLKPANLMLVPPVAPGQPDTTRHATVKILDVGLARSLAGEADPDREAEVRLTATGVALGTPDYLAPEQARDAHAADIRADIYSLGCVLYHAIAGQPPFPDTDLLRQLRRHASEPPRPVRELNPAVPDALEQILGWMLAKDPAQRYPTPARAAEALEVFLATATEPLPAPPRESYAQADGPRPGPAPAAAGAAMGEPAQRRPRKKPRRLGLKASPSLPPATSAAKAPKRKPKLPPRPEGLHAAAVEPGGSEAFDVELVPVAGPDQQAAAGPFSLTRRDLIMLSLGAGGVVLAALVGWLLAQLFHMKPAERPQPEGGETGDGKAD